MSKITFTLFLWSFFICSAQEKVNGDEKSYVLENEFRYISIEKDTNYLLFQFTRDSYLKISFREGESEKFIFIDNEEGFIALDNGEGINKVPFSQLPPISENDNAPTLEKLDAGFYNNRECDIYHVVYGDEAMKFYFEKEESLSFNSFISEILMLRGMRIDPMNVPKGKFIAGMEVESGKDKDIIELVSVKDNQKISFRLKTGE